MLRATLAGRVLLTLPAVASCVVTVLAFFVGVTTIAISSGPGWRELRWFGIAALFASVYGIASVATTVDVELGLRAFFGRLGGASASLLVASWFVYFVATQGRALTARERLVVGAVVAIGVAWLVPGLCRTSEVFVRTVPWLGVSYTTTRPTALGRLTHLFLVVVTIAIAAGLFRAARRGQQGARANLVGVVVQLVAGVNDALAASGKIVTPYALDLGQFAVVVAAGTTLVARFVADARALERSSAELRAAQKELVIRERLAALGELSAVVAHEVRNPVTVIFNAVSTLRKERVSESASTLLDIVDEEADRLKRVAGELLDFARPRAPFVHELSPAVLVEGAVEAAVAGFGGGDLVTVRIDPDLPDLAGDEQLLRQALVNLIMNGLQAPGRVGPVVVHAQGHGDPTDAIHFEVSDDGEGISEEVAAKLFTPFFTTRASGTGLGLPIVKRIADVHGGEVTWRRGEGRGVVFTLCIPLREAPRS